MSHNTIIGFRLSPQQKRIENLQQDDHIYLSQAVISFEGEIRSDEIRRALAEVMQQHEILRTTFQRWSDSENSLQIIHETASLAWERIELREMNPQAQETALARIARTAREEEFDLMSEQTVKASLVWLAADRRTLILTIPSMRADGVTLQLIVTELAKVLRERSQEAEAAHDPVRYVQFSEWQNGWLEDEEGEHDKELWQPGWATAGVQLPGLNEFSDSQPFQPATMNTCWAADLVQQIERTAQQYNATASAVVLAAWHMLLRRLSNQEHITIGTLFDGRMDEDLKGLLGPCSRYLPVTMQLAEDDSLEHALAQLSTVLAEVEATQDAFTWDLLAEENAAAGQTFWQIGFDRIQQLNRQEANSLRLTLTDMHSCFDRFNLRLSLFQPAAPEEDWRVQLSYQQGLVDEDYAGQLLDLLEALLRDAVAQPQLSLGQLAILNSAAYQKLLVEFNQTTKPFSGRPVHQLFSAQAAQANQRLAVIFEGAELSYSELNEQANRIAAYLRSQHVGPESVVAVYLEPCLSLLPALLGILKAGAAYLPIEINYPAERVRFILEDARAKWILTTQERAVQLPPGDYCLLKLDTDWSQVEHCPADDIEADEVSPQNLAYIIYTSGSTGTPKGVMVTHAGLSNYLDWCLSAYPLKQGGQGAPVHSSIGFDLTVTGMLSPLLAGETVTLVRSSPTTEALTQTLSRQKNFSFVKLTPAHLRMLRQQLTVEEIAASGIKALIVGGEALLDEDVAFWREASPETLIFNEYGPTETVVGCCVYQVPAGSLADGNVPIGSPIQNMELYVLDRNRQPVPVGLPGELYVGGSGLARGYLGRPDLTAERFVPNPFSAKPGARMYQTGDRVRFLPAGHLEYLGRGDRQVKIRGFRVELGEIEAVIQQIPSVQEVVALARNDGRLTDQRLIAYLVPRDGVELNLSELRDSLETKLPGYMIPAAFVRLESFPLTANGKIDRDALPSPEQIRRVPESERLEPLTVEEEILAGVWSQVLGIERVDANDNYFALGGDSIRSLQVAARAQERGLQFSIDDLFRYPTVRKLAAFIREASGFEAQPEKTAPFGLLTEDDKRKLPQGIEDAFPLTALQTGMIFHRELNEKSAIYHDLSSVYVQAPFDAELLEQAVQEMVQRHTSLRTWFDLSHYSEPLQLVETTGPVFFQVIDLQHLDEEAQERRLEQIFEEEKAIGFDFTKLPLIRFFVHVRGEDRWQFTLSFHHAILDGWSEATMITEMFLNYMSLVNAAPTSPAPPESLFRDYVASERAILASDEAKDYWDEKLRESSFIVLPRWHASAAPPPPQREIIIHEVPFSNEVSEGLKRLAVSNAVPIKDVLLAAHLRVVSLLSGQDDVLTCVVSSGRLENKDGDRAVGLFINSMPFRQKLSGGTWSELVAATFETEREALPYRRFPMAELKRRRGGVPLSETLFYFTHYHVYQSFQRVPDVELLGASLYEETSFALAANFRVDPFTSRVHFVLKCDAYEFPQEQVEAIGEYYKAVLIEMALSPDGRYDEAELIPPDELQQILSVWSGAAAAPSVTAPPLALTELFEAQVERTPQRVAIVCEGEQLSYEELNRRANQLAWSLRQKKVGPEVLVGLCVPRSLEMVIGILGILKAGGAYVPLDPDYPRERLSFILANTQTPLVVTMHSLLELFPEQVEKICLDSDAQVLAEAAKNNPPCTARPDNTAYVIYTSGSTGQPKGTLVSHRNVVRLFAATRQWFNFSAQDVWTMFHSFGFDFSVWELWGALLHGGRVVIVPQMVSRTPSAFYDLLLAEKVTVLNQTPSAFRQLSGEIQTRQTEHELALRLVIFGGEALEFASLQPWFERFGDERPQLVNMYGITETTIHVTYRPLTTEDSLAGQGSIIGFPIPDLQAYVLDQKWRPVPAGACGELYVGGAGVARGYLQRPDFTAERFIPNPFSAHPGARLYRTGDLVRFKRDGQLEYLGRADDQVKIRGYRIELGEIETTLHLHPQVREAVVLAREDQPGDKRLAAYVVGEQGATLNTSELRTFLKERLPAYMVPNTFSVMEALPVTSHGKVDRKALAAPLTTRPDLENEYVAPRDEVEEILSNIWAETLNVERVGIHDDFFELGGHSLAATLVIARLREAFKLNLPLRALYEAPTIEGLATEVVKAKGLTGAETLAYVPLPSIEPDLAHRFEPFPLTDIQQAYWIGRQPGFELGDISAHIYLEFDATGLNFAHLEEVINRLIRRHDMLRAVILPDGQQQILENVPRYEIELKDLRELPVEEAETQIQAVRRRMSHQKFATDIWPLFEIKAHLLEGQHYRLHFSIDLLITDADSLGILNRELGHIYQHPDVPLPDLEISFREYVLGEMQLRQTEAYDDSKNYWLRRIQELPSAPQLPLVHNYGQLPERRFSRLRGGLSPELWKRLKARAARSGLTPSGLLLAAYAEILALWSKKQQFTINVTTYNCLPLHPQARYLVGDFTTLTLVGIDSTQETFEERAKKVQAQFVDDLDHSYFGGIAVMRELVKLHGDPLQAAMPVVFTSTLPLHTREGNRQPPFPVELIEGVTQSPQTLLDHQVSEEAGALTVRWDYLVQAFPPGVIEEMMGVYSHLLQSLATEESAWDQTSRHWLLPPDQLQRRQAYNQTASPLPTDLLHQPFQRQARLQPLAPAILSARRSLTYGQLQREVTDLATRLRAHGIGRADVVAVVMEKGWEQVVAVLAILEAGAAYLPVDAGLPAARRNYLIESGEVRLALVQPWLTGQLTEWPAAVTQEPVSEPEPGHEPSSAAPEPLTLTAEQSVSDLAYIIYTSGSTGQPKGVMISHLAAQNTIAAINERFAVGASDRVLALSALSFDLSVYDIFGVLGAGGSVVLPDAESGRDPQAWARLISEQRVSVWNSVPALMQMLVESVSGGERGEKGERAAGGGVMESLRLVLLSGDWINVSLPGRIRQVSRGAQVVSLGGATECGIWSVMHEIEEVKEEWRSIPYGRPLANQRLYVLNEKGESSPEGVTGEIYIGGAGLALGYKGDEEKTRERFISRGLGAGTEPGESRERLYRTGDLGRYAREGWIEFLGREDTQVKVQGHRIELGEVEAALCGHEGVKEAVVAAVGEAGGLRRLIAYVVPHQAQKTSVASVKDACVAFSPQSQVVTAVANAPATLLDADKRAAFKKAQLALREDVTSGRTIELYFNEDTDEVGELYFKRRTHRVFRQEPIPFHLFSEFIGCLRQIKLDGQPKYRYSSGGSLYPVQVYLHIKPGRVEGIGGGIYYYHPVKHRLICLEPEVMLEQTIHWPANQAAFNLAAFSLFLIADMDAITPMYGSSAHTFALLEAGIMTHLLETEAAQYRLGLCQIGSLDFDRIRGHFKLKENHKQLHSLVGGLEDKASYSRIEVPSETKEFVETSGNGHHASDETLTADTNALSADELRAFLRTKLPEALIPGAFFFLDKLPINANGKVDRKRLPAPEQMEQDGAKEFVLPQTELQQVIAQALQAELNLERVSIKDNFFDLGASSLHLVKMHRQLRSVLHREFPIVTLFRYSTVEQLAHQLREEETQPQVEESYATRATKQREALARKRRRP